MLDALGTAGSLAGLAAVLLGTVLAAPAARAGGDGWWALLGSGAVLSLLGALMSIASDALGGILALIGGVAVLAGAALGWPSGRDPAGAPRSR